MIAKCLSVGLISLLPVLSYGMSEAQLIATCKSGTIIEKTPTDLTYREGKFIWMDDVLVYKTTSNDQYIVQGNSRNSGGDEINSNFYIPNTDRKNQKFVLYSVAKSENQTRFYIRAIDGDGSFVELKHNYKKNRIVIENKHRGNQATTYFRFSTKIAKLKGCEREDRF